MKRKLDLCNSSDLVAKMAGECWQLGWEHGSRESIFKRSKRLTTDELMETLRYKFEPGMYELTWRRFHRQKFRQVYGAAFDTVRATRRAMTGR